MGAGISISQSEFSSLDCYFELVLTSPKPATAHPHPNSVSTQGLLFPKKNLIILAPDATRTPLAFPSLFGDDAPDLLDGSNQ